MTSPDLLEALRSGAVLADDELVRRGDVLRVLRSLAMQDADLALYGATDNARAREYGEAAMTRACCAVAIMPASPDHTADLVALIEGLRKERDEAVAERNGLMEVLGAEKPFVFDPATHFLHADDGGAPMHGVRYEPAEVAAEAERDALRERAERAVADEREACALLAWQFATKAVPPDGPRVAARLIWGAILSRADIGAAAAKETGWLAELRGSTPSWAVVNPGDYDEHWTTDSTKALRFARKADAEAFIAWHGWTEAFPSEHIWDDGRALTQEQPNVGE